MRFVIIMCGGRSGSDLLQSLFDSHREVIQFPGILKFSEDFLKIFNLDSPKKIAINFCNLNPHFFNSRLNLQERHNKLGNKKNSFYLIDKSVFIKNFIKFYKGGKQSNLNTLVALHKAYGQCISKIIKKKKIIVLHIHLVELFENYLRLIKFDKKTKILLTFRDPMASLSSAIRNYSKYKKGKILTPRGLYDNFEIHFNTFHSLKNFKNYIRVVKLEDLHKRSKKTLKNICNYIKIQYSNTLMNSTYHGKKWWGDAISGKYLDGLNPNFKNKINMSFFSTNEFNYLETKLLPTIKRYNYESRGNIEIKRKYHFLPFGFEINSWRNTVRGGNLKSIVSILYFYIKRILLLGKNNNYNFNYFPKKI